MSDAPTLPAELRERFRAVAFLGSGGAGKVYLAEDLARGERVALKYFTPREGYRDDLWRFRQEAEVAGAFDHPHLVRVLDHHVEDGRACFVTYEYVDGASLDGLVAAGDLPDVAGRIRWVRDVGTAVAALHAQDLLHRDIKPGNILVRAADGHAFLCDFGLVRIAGATIRTTTGVLLGTPMYLAPEAWRGDRAGAAADQFALAAVLHELVLGQAVYPGRSPADIFAFVREGGDPATLAEAAGDPALTLVLRRALAAHPDDRYPDVAAMVADLDAVLEGRTPAPPASPDRSGALLREATIEPGRAAGPRRGRVMGIPGVVALALAAGYLLGRPTAAPPPAHPPPATADPLAAARDEVRETLAPILRLHPGPMAVTPHLPAHVAENRAYLFDVNFDRRWIRLLDALRGWVAASDRRAGPADPAELEFVRDLVHGQLRHLIDLPRHAEGRAAGLMLGEVRFGAGDPIRFPRFDPDEITRLVGNKIALETQCRALVRELAADLSSRRDPSFFLALTVASSADAPEAPRLLEELVRRLRDIPDPGWGALFLRALRELTIGWDAAGVLEARARLAALGSLDPLPPGLAGVTSAFEIATLRAATAALAAREEPDRREEFAAAARAATDRALALPRARLDRLTGLLLGRLVLRTPATFPTASDLARLADAAGPLPAR